MTAVLEKDIDLGARQEPAVIMELVVNTNTLVSQSHIQAVLVWSVYTHLVYNS